MLVVCVAVVLYSASDPFGTGALETQPLPTALEKAQRLEAK